MTSIKLKSQTAFIFARAGSKGIKDKNIRVVGGKPLIVYTIETALQSSYIKDVIVSTDSQKIAKIAKDFGARILERPEELAEDETPEILAWRHAIKNTPEIFEQRKDALFISLPATSPLRKPEDIDKSIQRYIKGDCDIVFGITPSTNNPYLSMVKIEQDDLIHIAIKGSDAVRRQDVPPMYNITGCAYITNTTYVKTCDRLIDGKVGYVIIPAERSLDIDTDFDLYLADQLLKHPYAKEIR